MLQFDQSDGFEVESEDAQPIFNKQGVGSYVIDGMRVSVDPEEVFLYPEEGSARWWSGQSAGSTSLGSAASAQFELSLDSPALGQTFDMKAITLIGYSSTNNNVDPTINVEFTGVKSDNSIVTKMTQQFEANLLTPLVVNFGTEFEGLVSLTWQQGGTNRLHQFDNITFSTVSAVPEPGSFLAIMAVTLVGVLKRARRLSVDWLE
ncbi:protein containing DUF1559 [Rhodopirellula baltica SH28]|uniref:Protein containing DUF1559 n=1 Tax=Rhodopirellula baltica SH28 TaxID=993517 RepID=K5EAI2_RHOBT|nr:protein containing DUF1559 [Rhodopirellula baltica SH28]